MAKLRYKRILKLYRELMILEVMNYIITTSRNRAAREPASRCEMSVTPSIQGSSSHSEVESIQARNSIPTTIYHSGSLESAVSYLVIDESSVAASLSNLGSRDFSAGGIAAVASKASMDYSMAGSRRSSRYGDGRAKHGEIEVSLVDSRDCIDDFESVGSFGSERDRATEPKVLTSEEVKEMERVVESTFHALSESRSMSSKGSVEAAQSVAESQSTVFQMLSGVQKQQLNDIVTNVFDRYMFGATEQL